MALAAGVPCLPACSYGKPVGVVNGLAPNRAIVKAKKEGSKKSGRVRAGNMKKGAVPDHGHANGFGGQLRSRSKLRIRSVMEPPSKAVPELAVSIGTDAEIPAAAEKSDTEWKVLPDVWRTAAREYGDLVALYDPHRSPAMEVTFKQLEQDVLDFAEGLRLFGVGRGSAVSLFSENSPRWLIADQGIMSCGALGAVRGAKAPLAELTHIVGHSDSIALVVETPELLSKLLPALERSGLISQLRFAVTIWPSSSASNGHAPASQAPIPVHSFEDVIAVGHTSRLALAAAGKEQAASTLPLRPDEVATLVYTSGTGGFPKGVLLTHANLVAQLSQLPICIRPGRGSRFLSLLPPWHMYERTCEYFALSRGCQLVYSQRRTFKEDLKQYSPNFFVAVPLVFELLYNGVQKKLQEGSALRVKVVRALVNATLRFFDARRVLLGHALAYAQLPENRLQTVLRTVAAAITAALLFPLQLLAQKLVFSKVREALNIREVAVSGGGSLPPQVDRFFEAAGIKLVNGYGLTECAPVLAVRTPEVNVLGTIGGPLPHTEIRVVDMESGQEVKPGIKGRVKARGPQVMKGYHKDPVATAAAIDSERFFNTGDLGWIAPHTHVGSARHCGGMLVLDGREKDTIVLRNGENVEPVSLELAMLQSRFVDQIMLVGQDQKRLGAFVVQSKDEDFDSEVSALMKGSKGKRYSDKRAALVELVRNDVNLLLERSGFELAHERVGPVAMIEEPFSIENGLLTSTMKMKRDVIANKYKDKLESMYAET